MMSAANGGFSRLTSRRLALIASFLLHAFGLWAVHRTAVPRVAPAPAQPLVLLMELVQLDNAVQKPVPVALSPPLAVSRSSTKAADIPKARTPSAAPAAASPAGPSTTPVVPSGLVVPSGAGVLTSTTGIASASTGVAGSGTGSGNVSPGSGRVELPSSDAQYLHNPKPEYPLLSKRRGEQGRAVVNVLISIDGTAEKAEIKVSTGFDRLDQAALTTVKSWRYVPGKRGGTPEAMWFLVPIQFVIE